MHRNCRQLTLIEVGVWIKLDKAAYTLLSPGNDKRCGNFLPELHYVLLLLFLLVCFCHLVVKREQGKTRELRMNVIHAHVSRTHHRSRGVCLKAISID